MVPSLIQISVRLREKKTREIIGACETNAHRTALALVRALSVLFKHVSYKYRKVFCGTPVGKARGRLKFLFFLLSSGLLGVLIHKKKVFQGIFFSPNSSFALKNASLEVRNVGLKCKKIIFAFFYRFWNSGFWLFVFVAAVSCEPQRPYVPGQPHGFSPLRHHHSPVPQHPHNYKVTPTYDSPCALIIPGLARSPAPYNRHQ